MKKVLRGSRMLTWSLALMAMLALPPASAVYTRFRGLPATYTKTFTATGLVEGVRYNALIKDVCIIEVANYNWSSLSEGFPLQDIPKEGDSYSLRAVGTTCQAVRVAQAGAKGHIRFSAGEDRLGFWFMLESPEAATGCGGLLIDWQPRSETTRG